jgi:TRAP-type C4-dicarboxylate transport system substrate-binding protein
MHERQLLKIQKQRHMSNIRIMLLNNALFKNLSERDQKKISKLIYKAEMIEMHARDRKIIRVNESFEDIVTALMNGLTDDDDRDRDRRDLDDDDFMGDD